MGLLDLSTGDPLTDLGLVGGLLSARMGKDNIGPLMFQAAAAKQSQQKMERDNRANDLAQLSGTYNLLKQQEFGRYVQSQQTGQPYTPNPQLAQLESRMTELLGKSNLSSGQPVLPPPAPQAMQRPPQAPMQPPMQGQPQQTPQQPQQGPQQPQTPSPMGSGSGIGGPAAGIPAQVWMAQDPSGKSYLEQLAKDRQPIPGRAGAPIWQLNPATGKLEMGAYAPKLAEGMQPTMGANGQVASADLIPQYLQGISAVKSAEAGAGAAGRMPFEKPDTIQTAGAPSLMTPRQQITAATGQDPLSVSPQVQQGRNSQQLQLLQAELQRAGPQEAPAIQTQIAALQRAQGKGDPFSYSSNVGLPLQDQGAAAAQKELGQKIGGSAADVFTNGAASVQGKRMLAGMADMAKSYDPGKFQPLQSQLAQMAAPIMGEDFANKIFQTNTGDIQGLTSAAISMAGKLTRQTDAQPSQLQFLKTLESMPMANRTPQGFARIMDYLNSMHDYNIEKMISLQQWLNEPGHQGDPSGFEAAWAQKSKDLPFVWNKTAPARTTQQASPQTDPLIVTAPDGSSHRFPSIAAANAFRKVIGQ